MIAAERIKFMLALFLSAWTAGGLASQEPPVPKPGLGGQQSQAQKVAAQAQSDVPAQDTHSALKVRVNLVQIQVIVRDDKGQPVPGLHKEDFQIYDSGKLQPISTFEVADANSTAESAQIPTTEAGAAQLGALNAISIPRRFIALTFDDVHLRMPDVVPIRLAAGKYVDAMGPGDRVGIFTTSGQLTQDFTRDKGALKEKLQGLLPRGGLTNNTLDCPEVSYYVADRIAKESGPPYDGSPTFGLVVAETVGCMPGASRTAAALAASQVSKVLSAGEAENRNTYRQLDNVLTSLAGKPGQRMLLLASPGFPVGRLLNGEESGIIEHANRTGVVINAIDARGLYAPDLLGDIAHPPSVPANVIAGFSELRASEQIDQQFVLMDFASSTGGELIHNSNDLEGGLTQLGSVVQVSYVLGFSPQNQKMDGHFHVLKVTLTGNQKYEVQARRGYYNPKKESDPQEAEKQEVQEALLSRNEVSDLPMTFEVLYVKSENAAGRLNVVLHLDFKGMRFRTVEGKHLDDVTFATAIFDENGSYITGSDKTVKLNLPDETYQKMIRTGVAVRSTFDLKPGKYIIREVAHDSEGAQMAARNGVVVIPN
jgi:VWFA-related protein